ncbi:MAG: glycosyltransferase [Ardenticatenaceae bacterium]
MLTKYKKQIGFQSIDRVSAAGLLLSGGTLLLNLFWFRRPNGTLPADPPFVSILVPARNEERAIEACVRSLLAQDYPAFELIVLDDHSEDRTGDILQQLITDTGPAPFGQSMPPERGPSGACPEARAVRINSRLLQGAPLPPGWVGKNWACHQLAQAASARSRYLLFTDADTTHAPDALRRAVAEAERDGVDLLSLMPTQQVETWAERLTVPLLALQILGYLPLPAVEWLPIPAFAAANGQFMLFKREAYREIGGHAACANIMAEDVTLARLLKKYNRQVRLKNGVGLVTCRMYYQSAEVIAGFRRSFASGFRLDRRIAGAVTLINFVVYLLPFLRAIHHRSARLLAAIIIALRLILAWQTNTPLRSAIAHPIGITLMLWAQLLAIYDAFIGKQAQWKGRQYSSES